MGVFVQMWYSRVKEKPTNNELLSRGGSRRGSLGGGGHTLVVWGHSDFGSISSIC